MRALLDLTDQVDLRALVASLRASGQDRRARSLAVIGALERTASRQQSRIAPVLDSMLRDRSLDSWTPVAIVNRIVVEGTPGAVLALARSPEVARVLPDWTSEARAAGSEERILAPAELRGERFTSWAIRAMGADALWREGLDGKGVVVATIDTGAMEDHEQLAGRRLEGSRGWFDPVHGTTRAFDSHGHGTGVLSLAVGGNPPEHVLGIAPGARWATALGLHRNFYSRSRVTLAADWVLRVARPDVLVNPWSHAEGSCNAFDLPFIDAWKAAGIFVVFPAGNSGPGPSTGEAPATLAGVFPDGGAVFSAGGLLPDGDVVEASSRGPSPCGAAPFPTLSAPGANLPYALASGSKSYSVGTGTSFAAALVGGAAALLLEADPSLDPEEVERLLVEGCRDLPPPGPDDASGCGTIDLERSLALLRLSRASSLGKAGSVRQHDRAVGADTKGHR